MKKITLLFILLFPLLLAAQPRVTDPDAAEAAEEEALLDELMKADSASIKADSIRAAILYQQSEIDRALLEWGFSWLDTTACTAEKDTAYVPDSVYSTRLSLLPNEIPMPYNNEVRGFIEMYVKRRPRQVASLKRVSEYYFPIFEDKLNEYGLPLELKYLAVIESALNANARSRVGAAGLWQFMPATGRGYGLEVNSLVDERLDPYKSTDAACRYLRTLYRLYGDWHLAIASYNCGPGNVNKAIKRSGGKKDFWAIYPWLPRETRAYVPIFIAANYALNYADEHGICPDTLYEGGKMKQKDVLMAIVTDTIHTSKRQHLEQTSGILGVPMQELRRLNPAYLKDILPGGKEYTLVLPIEYTGAYIEYQDSILAFRADSLLNRQTQAIAVAQQTSTPSAGGTIYYKVKKGDTLSSISKKYGVSVKQLQRWNNLSSTNIRIDQRLKIMK